MINSFLPIYALVPSAPVREIPVQKSGRDQHSDSDKLVMQVSHFPFEELLPELQRLIIENMDSPTQSSLGWTCSKFYPLNANFNSFRFADQCAALGYRTLLAYSFDCGGPLDSRTASVAAKHGQLEILQLFEEKKILRATDAMDCAKKAAQAGKQRVLDWLWPRVKAGEQEILKWGNDGELNFSIAASAAKGAQVALALEFFNKMDAVHQNAKREPLAFMAVKSHNWEAIRVISHELVTIDRMISNVLSVCPEVLPELPLRTHHTEVTDYAICIACQNGHLSVLKMAEKHGIELSPMLLFEYLAGMASHDMTIFPTSQHFECLKFLHDSWHLKEHPISFPLPLLLPPWATVESAQWMTNNGYDHFDMQRILPYYLCQFAFAWNEFMVKKKGKWRQIDLNLISWMLQQGAPVNRETLLAAAATCNMQVLEKVWAGKTDTDTSNLLASFFVWALALIPKRSELYDDYRVQLAPLLNTCRWLHNQGVAWDESSVANCTAFIKAVPFHNQKNAKKIENFISEMRTAGMPFSINLADHLY